MKRVFKRLVSIEFVKIHIEVDLSDHENANKIHLMLSNYIKNPILTNL